MPKQTLLEPDVSLQDFIAGPLWIQGVEYPRGAPPGNFRSPIYRVGQPGQTNWIAIIGGDTQSKIIPGSTGLTIRNNADTVDEFTVDGSGNLFAPGVQYSVTPSTTNPASVPAVYGGAGSLGSQSFTTTPIASGVASRCGRIYIPNNNVSFVASIMFRAANIGTNLYHSTRVGVYTLAVDRVTGSAAVPAIGGISGAAIATSGTATLTCTLTLNAVAGAVGALNTIDIFANITTSDANAAEIALYVESLNGAVNGSVIGP